MKPIYQRIIPDLLSSKCDTTLTIRLLLKKYCFNTIIVLKKYFQPNLRLLNSI